MREGRAEVEGKLQLGICMGRPTVALAAQLSWAGCEYYEPPVAAGLMSLTPAAFDAELGGWSVGGLAPKSANVLVPATLPVVGERVDDEALEAYLREAMRRARVLGLEVVVFGSGSARRVPEGFPIERAREQFGAALVLAADLAGPGLVVAAEHLRRAETNLVNSLAEAAALVRELDRENLAVVVDGYHLAEEGEDLASLRIAGGLVRHVHVAGAGRRPPEAADEDDLAQLLGELAHLGYEGRCSIEARWGDLASEAPGALSIVRRAAGHAGFATGG